MANMCLYEPITGLFPKCNGVCRKGKNNYCAYYFVDEIYALLEQWRTEARVETPLLIQYDYKRKKMVIYTTKPGYLIGYQGTIINKYSKLLSEKLRSRFINGDGIQQNHNFIELVECNDAVD